MAEIILKKVSPIIVYVTFQRILTHIYLLSTTIQVVSEHYAKVYCWDLITLQIKKDNKIPLKFCSNVVHIWIITTELWDIGT